MSNPSPSPFYRFRNFYTETEYCEGLRGTRVGEYVTGRGTQDGAAHCFILRIYVWKEGCEIDMSIVVFTCFWQMCGLAGFLERLVLYEAHGQLYYCLDLLWDGRLGWLTLGL